jgi:peptide/nickel transport system substrate-binding protein
MEEKPMFLNKYIRMTLVTALIGTMFALTACGGSSSSSSSPAPGGSTASSAPTGNKVVHIGLKADPPNLDPFGSTALVDRMVQNSIFDKLFDLDKDGKIIPMLAESYEADKDGKIYTIKLKKDIKFQDGTDFNADAVKFNLDRYKGEQSKRKNELKFADKLTVVDPNTIKIELTQPFSPFISVLTDRAGMMVSPEAVKKYGDDFLNHPVGTGPFVFVDHVKGDHVTLKRNDNYWNGKPKLDGVEFKVFTNGPAAIQNLKSGQLDMLDDLTVATKLIPSIKDDANLTVISNTGMGYQGIHLNVTKEPFTNKYLRQAINQAIDRDAVVKVLLDGFGSPANSPFFPGNLAYGDSDKYEKPDAAKIKDLLAKGGKSDGFSFKFQIGTSPSQEQFGAIVQSMLKPYNINVELEKIEFGQLLENGDKGNFQALQIGWSGRPDPDQSFYDFVVTKGSQNLSHSSKPELDKLATDGRQELDGTKRKAIYDKAMDILHDESNYVYLYHINNVFGLSNKISGFNYVPDGVIRTATLDKK